MKRINKIETGGYACFLLRRIGGTFFSWEKFPHTPFKNPLAGTS